VIWGLGGLLTAVLAAACNWALTAEIDRKIRREEKNILKTALTAEE